MELFKEKPLLHFVTIFFIGNCLLLSSCSEEYNPKPKGYNRIELAKHEYKKLDANHPYTFEYSTSATILKDSSWLAEPHWLDIYYPSNRCNIQITYKKFGEKKKDFDALIDDSHRLTNKHNVRAYSIDESVVKTPNGYYATIFELSGEVPSQFQFYVTDSSKHFLRGALYFRTAIKNDSLAPVIEYMKIDAMKIINTLKFEN